MGREAYFSQSWISFELSSGKILSQLKYEYLLSLSMLAKGLATLQIWKFLSGHLDFIISFVKCKISSVRLGLLEFSIMPQLVKTVWNWTDFKILDVRFHMGAYSVTYMILHDEKQWIKVCCYESFDADA